METFNEIENKKQLEILQNKLNGYLTSKAMDVKEALEKFEQYNQFLNDYIVSTKAITYGVNSNADNNYIIAQFGNDVFRMHNNAVIQLSQKLGIPTNYIKNLLEMNQNWANELAVQILNTHTQNVERERLLVRAVNGYILGMLSDSYRRLNSLEIFKAFLQEVSQYNAKIIDAYTGETRNFLEVIIPEIHTIVTEKNGVVHFAYGAQIRNSDFGNGALEVSTYKLVVKCLNGLTGQSLLKQVHLGKRLPDNLILSEETYKLDTMTMASATKDVIRNVLSRDAFEKEKMKILKASAVDVDFEEVISKLPQYGVNKNEAKGIMSVLLKNDPNDGLEGSSTLWKFAQGMTAYARDLDNKERKRDLMEVADKLLELK